MPPALERDLRRLVKGDVLCDDVSRVLYSTAACIFQMMPKGVVVPRDRDDVVAVVEYCREQGIPITARGAGSGLAGQTLGEGIILDFTKYMNALLEVNAVQSWVRVQPGIVLGNLNRALSRYGLWFPPDPSSGDVATIGGMIANNAAGAHTVKYGATREYILALETVLDDGSCARVEPGDRARMDKGRYGEIYHGIDGLLRDHEGLIARSRPDAPKNSSGYHLWDVAKDGKLDLNRLLVGSEGTLALVTEAKLKLIRKPSERVLIRFLFDSPEAACEAVLALRPLGPAAVELLDRTILDLVRDHGGAFPGGLDPKTQSVLLVEFDGEVRDRIVAQAEEARKKVKSLESRLAIGGDYAELWKIRKAASPILDRLEGPLRSTRIIEDVCVNPERLPDYLRGLRKLFKKHGVEGVIFGHAGSGHIHVNLLMNPDSADDFEKLTRISGELADLVVDLKGTLSGEHGDGILRAPYLRRTYADLHPLFEKVKRIFDPRGLFNPGKKVCAPDYDFRTHLRGSRRPDQTLKVGASFDGWHHEIERCNGCGHCRTYCPVFQAVPDESSTPRAKANLLEGILEGRLELDPLVREGTLREVADRCINCKLCLVHCPSLVDIPGMCLEAKALDTDARGLSKRDRTFAEARRTSERLARWSSFSNVLLRNRVFRWGLRAFRGIASKRRFPHFEFDRTQPQSKPGSPKVVYFSGCAADTSDPGGERRATIEVLQHNGFEILVPEGLCCGLPALSLGSRMNARDQALQTVQRLRDWLDEGLPIVVSSASCAGMLRSEYGSLLGTALARRVGESVRDIHEFLLELHGRGALRTDFKRIPATCIVHPSCGLQAAGLTDAPRKLLSLIPEIQFKEAPVGCCGMAGSFGYKAETYETSMAIARRMTDEMRRLNPTFLVTTNGACRPQLEQGTNREVLHAITLLHKAYGLSSMSGIHREHEGIAMQRLAGSMERSDPVA